MTDPLAAIAVSHVPRAEEWWCGGHPSLMEIENGEKKPTAFHYAVQVMLRSLVRATWAAPLGLLTVLTCACSSGSAGTDGVVFAPHAGLGPGALARPIGVEFSVLGQALRAGSDGRSWLLWSSFASPDPRPRATHLDYFDVDGSQIGTSPLAALNPDSFVLHESGSLTAWRGNCRETNATCLYRDTGGSTTEHLWSPDLLRVVTWKLDWNGDVTGTVDVDVQRRVVQSGAASGNGLYVLTNEGATRVHSLDGSGTSVWSVEVFPWVAAPPVPPGGPEGDIIRAARLTQQSMAKVIAVDDGVVIAAVVTRGTLAALAASSRVVLPLPADPFCGDVVVVRVSADGRALRYWSVPTPECEALPELAVVAGHAVVSTWVPVAIAPLPNDTYQYDIGLAILDLSSGAAIHKTIGMSEDDIVQATVPCGAEEVCLAGMTGSRSVDTGSRVTFGDGFVLPISLDGTVGRRLDLHSERHTTIPLLAPRNDGSVLFFATVNGPITHTGDADPSLRHNGGLLGVVTSAARR